MIDDSHRSYRNPIRCAVVFLIVVIVLPAFCHAADEAEDDGWRFTFVPLYLWATGITGSQSVGEGSSEIEVDFASILDNLDAGYSFYFEAGKGRWSLWIDTLYMDLRPEIEDPTLPLDLRLQATIFQGAVAYRLVPHWDVYLGTRSTDTDLRVDLGQLPLLRSDDRATDVIVGTRFRKAMTDRWIGSLGADIGFGDSDLSWQALATFQFRFTRSVSLGLGMRFLKTETSTGSGDDRSETKVLVAGPFLGASFRW